MACVISSRAALPNTACVPTTVPMGMRGSTPHCGAGRRPSYSGLRCRETATQPSCPKPRDRGSLSGKPRQWRRRPASHRPRLAEFTGRLRPHRMKRDRPLSGKGPRHPGALRNVSRIRNGCTGPDVANQSALPGRLRRKADRSMRQVRRCLATFGHECGFERPPTGAVKGAQPLPPAECSGPAREERRVRNRRRSRSTETLSGFSHHPFRPTTRAVDGTVRRI
jgi:hypothetical protein